MEVKLLREAPELITILLAEPSAKNDGTSVIGGVVMVSRPGLIGATTFATFFRTGDANLPQHVALIAIPEDDPTIFWASGQGLWEAVQNGLGRKVVSTLSRWAEDSETLKIEGLPSGRHHIYAVGVWE